MLNREKKINNIYNDYNNIINRMKSLINCKESWLCCPNCFNEICTIKPGLPRTTNKKIGEHIIEGSFINELKTYGENKDKVNENDKKKFEEQLNKDFIKFDDLFCCTTGETIIGYIRNKNRYIYYKSNLYVKYPNLSNESVSEEEYKDDFKEINQKTKKIVAQKDTPEFKEQICCKLCDFTIQEYITEFKDHLKTECHKEKMEELKKEFSF